MLRVVLLRGKWRRLTSAIFGDDGKREKSCDGYIVSPVIFAGGILYPI
jgi:hypothetical protein